MHEYSVIGHPREKIVFWIAFISIIGVPFIVSLSERLLLILTGNIMYIALPVSVVFIVLYFLFNKYVWRCSFFGKLFGFPDLNGDWVCEGSSLNSDGDEKYPWSGIVKVEQSWDKFLITLKTDSSTSHSISIIGGIKYIPSLGFKVSYSYENNPSIDKPELKKHEGFCELMFDADLKSARGHYFNGPGRFTFGRITLRRDQK